jgi:hypothetical protein
MNVEIWAEAAQFPEKEYINGIAIAVHCYSQSPLLTDFTPHEQKMFGTGL